MTKKTLPTKDVSKPADKPKKGQLKRAATEAKIIKAFEKVLKRDGYNQLGVNAIVKEAGVGKGLIYEYFGGLEGLADAWVQKTHLIPDVEEIAGGSLADFLSREIHEQIGEVHVNYANYMRNTPLVQELMTEELLKHPQLNKSMSHIRMQLGKTHERFFTDITPITDPDSDDLALIFILQAAANYLALRSKSAPRYNGVQLDTEEGWNTVMAMMRKVAQRFASPPSDQPD